MGLDNWSQIFEVPYVSSSFLGLADQGGQAWGPRTPRPNLTLFQLIVVVVR